MIRKLISSALAASFMLGILVTLPACNTIQGAGKDIERGGEKIQQEAAEHKRY
jgi:predicted small secreted protein